MSASGVHPSELELWRFVTLPDGRPGRVVWTDGELADVWVPPKWATRPRGDTVRVELDELGPPRCKMNGVEQLELEVGPRGLRMAARTAGCLPPSDGRASGWFCNRCGAHDGEPCRDSWAGDKRLEAMQGWRPTWPKPPRRRRRRAPEQLELGV